MTRLKAHQRSGVLLSAFALGGCSFPGSVLRIAVDYNSAVAGMSDEVTFLNVVRAKEKMPLHYTGFNRLSGSITVSGAAKLNGAIKDTGTIDETDRQGGAGVVTDTLKRTLTGGGNIFTPEISAGIASGPSFDVTVFDSQKFYQGILGAIPFSTVANFMDQGFNNELLMRLLIRRVEFRLKGDVPGYGRRGSSVLTLENMPSGPQADRFATEIACYTLGSTKRKAEPIVLAPVSRVGRSSPDGGSRLQLADLALLDGEKLALDAPITADPSHDGGVHVVRLSPERLVATLRQNGSCKTPLPVFGDSPGSDPLYADDGTLSLRSGDAKTGITAMAVPVEIAITFRSPDGVIRLVGDYLDAAERYERTGDEADRVFPVDEHPLFSIGTDDVCAKPIVQARLLGRRYVIPDDAHRRSNMTVLALIEQLINLQKESGDRPTTVPVQVIP